MREIIQNSTIVIDTLYYEIVWGPLGALCFCILICFFTRLILCLNSIIKNRSPHNENNTPLTDKEDPEASIQGQEITTEDEDEDEDEDELPTYKEVID